MIQYGIIPTLDQLTRSRLNLAGRIASCTEIPKPYPRVNGTSGQA